MQAGRFAGAILGVDLLRGEEGERWRRLLCVERELGDVQEEEKKVRDGLRKSLVIFGARKSGGLN